MNRIVWLFSAFVIVAGLLLWSGVGSVTSQIDFQTWQIAGVTCSPSSQTIGEDLHLTQGGNVRFAPSKVGTITLFCPFPVRDVSGGQFLRITTFLQDGDGTGTGSRVAVSLRRLRPPGGNVIDPPGAIVDSNLDCSLNTTEWQECTIFPDRLSNVFGDGYYFFQVTLVRDNAESDVRFGGISYQQSFN
jgi:hypothetical protein